MTSGDNRRSWCFGLVLTFALLGGVLSGCGGGSRSPELLATDFSGATVNGKACAGVALGALEQVAQRVYQEAATGRVLAQAVRRVRRSRGLAGAVGRGDVAATRQILRGLIESQIVRIRVSRGSRVLAEFGRTRALAPVGGVLRDGGGQVVGSFVLSVLGANGYGHTVRGYTGARVVLRRVVRHRSRRYRVVSFAGQAFPSGGLRVTLLLPRNVNSPCGASAGEIVAETLGRVAMRIYDGERSGRRTAAIVRHVEGSPTFTDAVLSGSPAATRAAIVGLFRTHLHVVRVRAMLGERLLVDLGGPFVLAPAAGVVRDHSGRVAGSVLLAAQDDMGYMLLTHSFTGAQVLMRVGSRQVMGTLTPGPETIPDRGPVIYKGVGYQAFSFDASAFPSGTLRISLLVRETVGGAA